MKNKQQDYSLTVIIPITFFPLTHEKLLSKKKKSLPSSVAVKDDSWLRICFAEYTAVLFFSADSNVIVLLMSPLSSFQCHATLSPAFTSSGIVSCFETGIFPSHHLPQPHHKLILVFHVAQTALGTAADTSQQRLPITPFPSLTGRFSMGISAYSFSW